MIKNHKKTYYLVIIVFFIAGLTLRLIRAKHLDMFYGDNGIQLLQSERILKGEHPIGGEISRIDKGSKNIIHNSTIGLYFYTLVYLLGLKTPTGFLIIYLLLNLFSIYLLFKSACIIFSKTAGFFLTVFALFNSTLISFNLWTSQSSKAIIFDSLAIFIFTKYLKNKEYQHYLVLTFIFSFLATNLYSPMYLMFPIKIVFLIYLIRKIPNKKGVILSLILGLLLISAPLIIQEAKTKANINAVTGYFLENKLKENQKIFFDKKWFEIFFSYIKIIIQDVFPLLTWTKTSSIPWIKFLIALFLLYAIITYKNKSKLKTLGIISIFIIFPLILISSYCRLEYNSICPRPFQSIFIPYTLLLLGGLFSLLEHFQKNKTNYWYNNYLSFYSKNSCCNL